MRKAIGISEVNHRQLKALMILYQSRIIVPDNLRQTMAIIINEAFKRDVWPTMTSEERKEWDCFRATMMVEGSKRKTYIMRDDVTGLMKIGRSKNPRGRYHSLVVSNPHITLLYISDEDVEGEIHTIYANQKHKSEWFNLSQQDLFEIVNTYNFKKVECQRQVRRKRGRPKKQTA